MEISSSIKFILYTFSIDIVMRVCQKCDETNFDHVYGSVWKCSNCGKLSGNLDDLSELKIPIKIGKKEVKKRSISSYNPVKFRCKNCNMEIIELKWPEENEFRKLQGEWKKHQCNEERRELLYE